MSPADYDPKIIEAIFLLLQNGQSLTRICAQEGFPTAGEVAAWCEEDASFNARLERSKRIRQTVLLEECMDIADDGSGDYVERRGTESDGFLYRKYHRRENVLRSKLRIDYRLEMMGIENPKKFGKKMDINHGGQKDNPLRSVVQSVSGKTIKPKE